MAHKLSCGCSGRSDAHSVNNIVKPGLKQEQKILTFLASHAGSLQVSVVELPFQQAVHVSYFLLLLQLDAIFTHLLALCSQSMLSRRIIPFLEILIAAKYRLAEFTGDFCTRTSISCHGNFFLTR